MTPASLTHLVLIPSYNPGSRVVDTVLAARRQWNPVWIVVDGSTDGSAEKLQALAAGDEGLKVVVLPENRGKGAAVLEGITLAAAAGFTHALTMDSDGQHPADLIPAFMAASQARPRRRWCSASRSSRPMRRRCASMGARCRTAGPIWKRCGWASAIRCMAFASIRSRRCMRVMDANRWMRRFDFDPEAVVRLCWAGVRPVNLAAPVRYFRADEGGVSHFRYLRDNTLLTWMHTRLFLGFLRRLPVLAWRRLQSTI